MRKILVLVFLVGCGGAATDTPKALSAPAPTSVVSTPTVVVDTPAPDLAVNAPDLGAPPQQDLATVVVTTDLAVQHDMEVGVQPDLHQVVVVDMRSPADLREAADLRPEPDMATVPDASQAACGAIGQAPCPDSSANPGCLDYYATVVQVSNGMDTAACANDTLVCAACGGQGTASLGQYACHSGYGDYCRPGYTVTAHRAPGSGLDCYVPGTCSPSH